MSSCATQGLLVLLSWGVCRETALGSLFIDHSSSGSRQESRGVCAETALGTPPPCAYIHLCPHSRHLRGDSFILAQGKPLPRLLSPSWQCLLSSQSLRLPDLCRPARVHVGEGLACTTRQGTGQKDVGSSSSTCFSWHDFGSSHLFEAQSPPLQTGLWWGL